MMKTGENHFKLDNASVYKALSSPRLLDFSSFAFFVRREFIAQGMLFRHMYLSTCSKIATPKQYHERNG